MLKNLTFFEENLVKSRNPSYFLTKQIRVKQGTMLIETVLSGDPLYYWKIDLFSAILRIVKFMLLLCFSTMVQLLHLLLTRPKETKGRSLE